MTTRFVARGANPFAPIAKLRNQNLTAGSPYETLADRVKPLYKNKSIRDAVEQLRQRLGDQRYQSQHFGRLELVEPDLLDINIDIQRLLEDEHIAWNIIANFDPRIVQPVNCTFIKDTGRYSAWDGQQSSAALAILKHFGLLAVGVKIQCKVFDDDLAVPGSAITGEAVGNFGFRTLNGKGRQPVDAYWNHRSRVNGVRRYGSELREDQQSHEIQMILEQHHMYPAPAIDARGRKAQPGMITYITGLNQIAGHDTDWDSFNITKQDLAWALAWHDTYFANEKGVDGGFILCFGRLHAESRGRPATKKEPGVPAVPITARLEKDLAAMIRTQYLTPHGFHEACKTRLKKWQRANNLKESWSDSCLAPFLVMDYLAWGGKEAIPEVQGMKLYAGI